MKKFIKENKIIVFLLVCSIVMLSGLSYAWYKLELSGEREITLSAGGNLSLTFDQGQEITLTNAEPVTNEEGLSTKGYHFSIHNTGLIDSSYTIYLDDLDDVTISGKRMSDSNIKYYLVKNNASIDPNKALLLSENTAFTDDGILKSRSIYSDTIGASETDQYDLYIWIADTATNNPEDPNDITNTTFKAKLRIVATQKLDPQPNAPELVGDMIPVVYDGTNWIKSTTDSGSWYNYTTQQWANAVTIKDPTKRDTYKNATVGTTIALEDINTFLVWIPRYSYTLGNTYGYQIDGGGTPSLATPGAFDIKFVSKTTTDIGSGKYTGNTASEYYTPSSFCFGDTCDDETHRGDAGNIELSGIWVSKFEMTGTMDDISSIPNVSSIRNQTVSSFFTGIQTTMNSTSGTSKYGFSGNYDTHMIKNTEWGTIAYLSQSKYGKYGNKDYTGGNREIYLNPSRDYITGSSSGAPSGSATGDQSPYNDMEKGIGASTTGTIYGIYDMAGGAYEYVMGVLNNNLGDSGFTTMPERKYYNYYSEISKDSSIKGDASGIDGTNGFYNDYYSVSGSYWINRGGCMDIVDRGIFYFSMSGSNGGRNAAISTRFVLTSFQ